MRGPRRLWSSALEALHERAPALHRFLTRSDAPYPIVRDLLGVGLVLLLMVVALWGLTGQDFPNEAPVVVVESGSMMHCANGIGHYGGPASPPCEAERYGRIGTIDPGDLIFVRDAPTSEEGARNSIDTFADGGKSRYGEPGDVIVFQKNGQAGTPIIHRAMFWLEVNEDGSYTIPALGQTVNDTRHFRFDGEAYRMVAGCRLQDPHGGSLQLRPDQSGFITKGDNNDCFDQSNGFEPVRPDWVMGRSRGELPWLGLLKLFATDLFGPSANYAQAPGDVKVMLWSSVAVLLGAPFVAERVSRARHRRREREEEP